MANLAVDQRTIKRNPFFCHKIEKVKKLNRYLSREQLPKIMHAELYTYSLSHTRDLFVLEYLQALEEPKWKNCQLKTLCTKTMALYGYILIA